MTATLECELFNSQLYHTNENISILRAIIKYLVKELFILLKVKHQKATSLGEPAPPYISLVLERKDPMKQSQRMPASEGINLESSISTAWMSPQCISQISLKSLPRKIQTPARVTPPQASGNQLTPHALRMPKPNNIDWLQLTTRTYYENIHKQWLNIQTMCKRNGGVSWTSHSINSNQKSLFTALGTL